MGFLKKIMGGKDEEIKMFDNASFWDWFVKHEKEFFNVVKSRKNVGPDFLDTFLPKIHLLNEQFYTVVGMCNDTTAELIITAEGDIKTFVFVEELIASAPSLPNWKFTALKPAVGVKDSNIRMDGYHFNGTNIFFVSEQQPEFPDQIDITVVHKDFNEEEKDIISNGTFIFMDNAFGELNTVTLLDSLKITGPSPVLPELISIEKLPEYLQWREKEFVEKYKAVRYNTEDDSHAVLEAEDEDGFAVVAVVNQDLLAWDAKPSHPWMMVMEIKYEGGDSGLPDEETAQLMQQFEDDLLEKLPDSEGYLQLGRETHKGERTIYYACKEFRHVSKTTAAAIYDYQEMLDIDYDIYKDKYWMTMERFKASE
jgi:hypothetical protein